jgi:hypothetical protein
MKLRAKKLQNHSHYGSSQTDDANYLIWKSCSEKSEAWQVEQKRLRDEANRKRSEAQVGIPKAETKERKATSSGSTLTRDYAKEQSAKTSTVKAAASHTKRGTVERMDLLWAGPTNRNAIRDVPETPPHRAGPLQQVPPVRRGVLTLQWGPPSIKQLPRFSNFELCAVGQIIGS